MSDWLVEEGRDFYASVKSDLRAVTSRGRCCGTGWSRFLPAGRRVIAVNVRHI